MGEAVRRKLRSQAGLSLSMAMLMFLVCMAVCSVVITAATASAGRLSQLARMDRRYYSVTSAAELLCAQVEQGPLVLTRQGDEAPTCAEDSLIARLTEKVLQGETGEVEFTIEPGAGREQLKAAGTANLSGSAQRLMTITLHNDNGEAEQYILRLDCTASVLTSTATVGGVSTTTYTVTWTVTGVTR